MATTNKANKTTKMNKVTMVQKKLADYFRARRLSEGFMRETVAERAGVSSSSLRRFELTGECSLKLLLKVASALGILEEFESITENEKLYSECSYQRGYR